MTEPRPARSRHARGAAQRAAGDRRRYGTALQRTSYNMMIYEVQDFCCALLDAKGRLIAQNVGGVSHFVSDLGVVIRDGLAALRPDGFKPGDVIITNHQRVAGQHLNNICIYTPCFVAGRLEGFATVRAHWVDVGGLSTGFSAASMVVDPWMEGLQLDQIKIHEARRPRREGPAHHPRQHPLPEVVDGRPALADRGLPAWRSKRLAELFHRYGAGTLHAAVERIFDETRDEVPQRGRQHSRRRLRGGVVPRSGRAPTRATSCRSRWRSIVSGEEMTIDLTGCSMQRKSALNGRTLAGAYIAYKGLTAPLEPVNEGSFRALKVEIQEGNFMMARFPAVMASWSRMLPTVVDTIVKALAPAMPDKIPAAHLGTLGGSMTFFGTDPKSGRDFILQTIEGGGWGGRPWEDGMAATVSVCQGDVRNAPIETVELKTPVRVIRRALRANSGGAGKFRGGFGQVTRDAQSGRGPLECVERGPAAVPAVGAGGRQGRRGVDQPDAIAGRERAEAGRPRARAVAARHHGARRDRRRRRMGLAARARCGAGRGRRAGRAASRWRRRWRTMAS